MLLVFYSSARILLSLSMGPPPRWTGWSGILQSRWPRRQKVPENKENYTYLQIHIWSVICGCGSVFNMKMLTISSGLTGYLSSVLEVFCTFPLFVTFLAFFSLAFLIWGVLGILRLCAGGGWCWRCSKCGETGAYVAVLDLLLDWDGWYQNCQHNTTCAQTAPIYIVSGTCHSLLAHIK